MQGRVRPLLWAAILTAGAVLAELPPVRSVATVDLQRYAGTWYEIAAFPMFFQRRCVGDTTAVYTLRDDGAVGVRNRCRTRDGFDEANGRATVVEGTGNAQLEVSFWWPFRGDYWVIGLADDYRWAVVGNPNRKYLWVLSRTPQLGPADLDQALALAARQGFDLGQLRMTSQSPPGDGSGAAR